jgi:hypothetical protein
MSGGKRFFVFIAIVAIAAIDIAIYWNYHLFRLAARGGAVGAEKVAALERAQRVNPYNETVNFELGQARFDLAMDQIGDAKARDAALAGALDGFERSLRLNPASARVQFQYAQALLYRSYLAPGDRTRVFDEYKKAARLTGHNAPTYFEVGRILLSQWTGLSEADRRFALDLLKTELEQPNKAKLATVLQIWDLSVRDSGVVARILPENADAWRQYAQFLGEKGLSLEERRRAMARAEGLEFEKARLEFENGDRLYRGYRFEDAFNRYQWCLGALKGIRFYQDLIGEKTVEPADHAALLKATYLNMAKCRLETGKPFEEALPFLRSYIDIEDEVAALGDLETFLRERGLIEENLTAGAKDYRLFAFHILLAFKQSRYRDIIQVGMEMQRGVLVVSESSKEDYARILEMVGDSYQKLDYIYESNGFYERALAQGTDDLAVLLKLRKNKVRLNDEPAVRDADARIARLLTPEETAGAGGAGERTAEKGRTFVKPLRFDGSDLAIEIAARGAEAGRTPLVAVVWNDRVVWEDLLQAGAAIRIDVKSVLGMNSLSLVPVNMPVVISRISWTFK